MKTPRCKKCGKVLTDPLSIALQLGPECRGDKCSKQAFYGQRKGGQPHGGHEPYQMTSSSSSALPAVFSAGRDARTHEPITFTLQEDGCYHSSAGSAISAETLTSWIHRFGVSISIVAPKPAGEAYPPEAH